MTDTLELKGGFITEDPRLDRLPQWDPRSENYPIRELITPQEAKQPRSYTWPLHDRLDQGQEGRCVEFGICGELIAKPKPVNRAKIDDIIAGRKIYWPAQARDEWEGGSYPGATPFYEGTSVHAGMSVATELGYYKEYRWAMDIEDLILAVGYKGPAVVGVDWYDGMYHTDNHGLVHATGSVVGGHCFCVNSVDVKRERFGAANSWGTDWGTHDHFGVGGYFYVSFDDMDTLMKDQGEMSIPVYRSL